MNTANDKYFAVLLVGIVALFTAFGYALTMPAAATAPQKIVKLERVVVVGKRAEMQAMVVNQLPRVVVTGKRDVSADDLKVAAL